MFVSLSLPLAACLGVPAWSSSVLLCLLLLCLPAFPLVGFCCLLLPCCCSCRGASRCGGPCARSKREAGLLARDADIVAVGCCGCCIAWVVLPAVLSAACLAGCCFVRWHSASDAGHLADATVAGLRRWPTGPRSSESSVPRGSRDPSGLGEIPYRRYASARSLLGRSFRSAGRCSLVMVC